VQRITRAEIFELLLRICDHLEQSDVPYLVYGSVAYALLTDDPVELHDIDIVVPESAFEALGESLKQPQLGLNPIVTPRSIHANSLQYEGPDGRPFDVSLDSWEHYFQTHGIDLGRYQRFGAAGPRLMSVDDLIVTYEAGLTGGNTWKREEYERKIDRLRSLLQAGEG
jgi:hypothetical protein